MREKGYPDDERLSLEELARGLEEDAALYVKADGTLVLAEPGEGSEEIPLTLSKPRQTWY